MGRIICNVHGEQGIVQISKSLNENFLLNKKVKVVKYIYEIENLNSIEHFFTGSEDLDQASEVNNIDDFELFFSTISNDPVACVKCFNEYIRNNDIVVVENQILIPCN